MVPLEGLLMALFDAQSSLEHKDIVFSSVYKGTGSMGNPVTILQARYT